MSSNYHRPVTDLNEKTEAAKLWWRSRTPEEREAALAPHLDKITPIVCITVPVPFCGLIEVFISSMRGREQFQVKVSKRALAKLRDLFSCPSSKKWRAKTYPKAVCFYHGGEIRKRTDPRSGGAF